MQSAGSQPDSPSQLSVSEFGDLSLRASSSAGTSHAQDRDSAMGEGVCPCLSLPVINSIRDLLSVVLRLSMRAGREQQQLHLDAWGQNHCGSFADAVIGLSKSFARHEATCEGASRLTSCQIKQLHASAHPSSNSPSRYLRGYLHCLPALPECSGHANIQGSTQQLQQKLGSASDDQTITTPPQRMLLAVQGGPRFISDALEAEPSHGWRPEGVVEREDSASYQRRPPALAERQDSASNLQVLLHP